MILDHCEEHCCCCLEWCFLLQETVQVMTDAFFTGEKASLQCFISSKGANSKNSRRQKTEYILIILHMILYLLNGNIIWKLFLFHNLATLVHCLASTTTERCTDSFRKLFFLYFYSSVSLGHTWQTLFLYTFTILEFYFQKYSI